MKRLLQTLTWAYIQFLLMYKSPLGCSHMGDVVAGACQSIGPTSTTCAVHFIRVSTQGMLGVGGGAVRSGTALHVARSWVRFIFHSLNFSGRNIVLVSTQLLTEVSTWDISRRKRRIGFINLSPSCANCLEILAASTSWNPKGLPPGLYRDCFAFYPRNFVLFLVRATLYWILSH